jgi:hypothetical protein
MKNIKNTDYPFICDRKKYIIGGLGKDHETICLPVSFNLPQDIVIDENILLVKTEFHVSLVCIGEIIKKYSINIPGFTAKVITDFCDFTIHTDINLLQCANEFRLVIEKERQTLIVMCEVSNLQSFFDLLNTRYNLRLEYPTTHITLFTLQPNAGIFLIDKKDIETKTSRIETPEILKKLLNIKQGN